MLKRIIKINTAVNKTFLDKHFSTKSLKELNIQISDECSKVIIK